MKYVGTVTDRSVGVDDTQIDWLFPKSIYGRERFLKENKLPRIFTDEVPMASDKQLKYLRGNECGR